MVQRCIAHVDCAKETKQVMQSRVQKNRQLKFVQYSDHQNEASVHGSFFKTTFSIPTLLVSIYKMQ